MHKLRAETIKNRIVLTWFKLAGLFIEEVDLNFIIRRNSDSDDLVVVGDGNLGSGIPSFSNSLEEVELAAIMFVHR